MVDAIPEGAPASLVAREVSACGTYFDRTAHSLSYDGAAVIDGAALTPLFGSSVSQGGAGFDSLAFFAVIRRLWLSFARY